MEINTITSNKGNIIEGLHIIKPIVYQDDRDFFTKAGINHLLIISWEKK